MVPNKRLELMAEIAELRTEQLASDLKATFGGWSQEEEAAHHKRADRIALLCGQLARLDLNGTPD